MRPEPERDEVALLLWDVSDGQLLRRPWESTRGPQRARFQRMANAVRALYAPRCCEGHSRNCEPPSELCCHQCAEAGHQMGDATRGKHADGSVCVNPDLSPKTLPIAEYQTALGELLPFADYRSSPDDRSVPIPGLRDRTAGELGLCDGAPADDDARWNPDPGSHDADPGSAHKVTKHPDTPITEL